MLILGLQHFSVCDLVAVKAAMEQLRIRVLGLATIAHDVTPELPELPELARGPSM